MPPDAVLLLDGVFLLRPELNPHWDFRIFVHTGFEQALQRAVIRDQHLFDSPQAAAARYQQRYFPAQRTYLQAVQPLQRADVIVENDDPRHPYLLTRI